MGQIMDQHIVLTLAAGSTTRPVDRVLPLTLTVKCPIEARLIQSAKLGHQNREGLPI